MNIGKVVEALNRLESKKVISTTANQRIQALLDFDYTQFGKLFLVLCGSIGVSFIAAGIFSLIGHNWDVFHKHVKGFLSLAPTLVALFFYYKAVFEKKTTVWIEVSTLFLFFMIGASIALISSTYQLNGDYDKFILVWLGLSIPLFYIAKASGFAIFYFGLMAYFAFPSISFGFLGIPSGYNDNEKIYWFWIFFVAFLPHLYYHANWKGSKQKIRGIYLGWLIALLFYFMLPFVFQGGWLFWAVSIVIGYFLIDQRFFSDNLNILARPFKFIAYLALFHTLVTITDERALNQLFRSEAFDRIQFFDVTHLIFYFLGLVVAITVAYLGLKRLKRINAHLKILSYLPFMILFLMLVYYINDWWSFDMTWLSLLIFNIYIIAFGLTAMIKGNNTKSLLPMFYGLFLICWLLWFRYFDLDWSFWVKGFFFILVGGCFFLINFIYSEELAYQQGHEENFDEEE